MSSTFRSRQIWATRCMYEGGGAAAPRVAPLTGSMMHAAAVPFASAMACSTAVGTAVAAIKGASIAVRDASLGKLAQHWKVNLPPCLVATNDYRTECRAVIALAAAHDLIALLVSAFHLILPCELECGLD